MLLLRKYTIDEADRIRKFLDNECIEDLVLDGIVYVVIDSEELVGVGKARPNKVSELDYLVIREDKRNQGLGDALLRALLNKLNNQGIEKIYYKTSNTYLMEKGFVLNDDNELELNIPDFFIKACNSCGGCNEL